MNLKHFLYFLFLLNLTMISIPGETQVNKLNPVYNSSIYEKQVEKTIKLKNSVEIKVGRSENLDSLITYSLFILSYKGKQIYIDTSWTEYEFGDTLYPLIIPLTINSFELLVEVNDRPNKNYIKLFKIMNNKVQKIIKMPAFINKAAILSNKNIPEFAGYWDDSEIWGVNNSLTDYNPILYYYISLNGLQLDSAFTIEKNKSIYGSFKGFHFSEKPPVPVSVEDKFDKEVDRIKHCKTINIGKEVISNYRCNVSKQLTAEELRYKKKLIRINIDSAQKKVTGIKL